MSDQPILITEHDVAEKPLLLRALRKVTDRLIMLGGRLSRLESAAQPPSIGQIRRELEATGSHPLYVGNLLGQLAEPQPAKVTHYETEPAGGTLQNMRDGQLVTVGTTSTGDNIYRVIGGNPNTLRPIQIGAASAPANMVTTDTVQNIGPGANKTFLDDVSITDNFNGSVLLAVTNTDAGNGAAAQVRAVSNAGIVSLLAIGSGVVATRYGVTLGNKAELTAFSTMDGMVIGTQSTAAAIHLGTGNAERVRIPAAGGLQMISGQMMSTVQYSASVYLLGTMAVTSTGATVVGWDSTVHNQGSVYTATSTSRLHARDTGVYIIGGQAIMAQTTHGGTYRRASIRFNGTTIIPDSWAAPATVGNNIMILSPVLYPMTSADYVEMVLNQDSTGTVNVGGVGSGTYLFLHKVC